MSKVKENIIMSNKDMASDLRRLLNSICGYITKNGISAKVNSENYKSSTQIHNFNNSNIECDFIKYKKYHTQISFKKGDNHHQVINFNFSAKEVIDDNWFDTKLSSSINLSVRIDRLRYIGYNFDENAIYFLSKISKNKKKRLNKMLKVYIRDGCVNDENLKYIFTCLKRNLNFRIDKYEIIHVSKYLSKSEKRHKRLSSIISKNKNKNN